MNSPRFAVVTKTEWGIQWHGLDVLSSTEEKARKIASEFKNAKAVRRVVGDWEQVE